MPPLLATNKPKILITTRNSPLFCGVETHMIAMHKMLVANGYDAYVLVDQNSFLEKHFRSLNLPLFVYPKKVTKAHQKVSFIRKICQENSIDMIVVNWLEYLKIAQSCVKGLKTKIVFFDHMHPGFNINESKREQYRGIHCVICVDPNTAELYRKINTKYRLNIQTIASLAPFFDQEKYSAFQKPQESRNAFFKRVFNIEVSQAPLVCMIANAYQNPRKNHRLLLRALDFLVHKKNCDVQAIMVGAGPDMPKIQKFADDVHLSNRVHFIGATQEIPTILHYSDIHVLPSKQEAFGLVHVEAAMMAKPSIGASETGADCIIKNNETGFIFKNNDVMSLASALEACINDRDLCHRMGNNAYTHVLAHFSNEVIFKGLISIFQEILDAKGRES